MTTLLIIGYLIGAALTWVAFVREADIDTADPVDMMFAIIILTMAALLFWVPFLVLGPIIRAVSR